MVRWPWRKSEDESEHRPGSDEFDDHGDDFGFDPAYESGESRDSGVWTEERKHRGDSDADESGPGFSQRELEKRPAGRPAPRPSKDDSEEQSPSHKPRGRGLDEQTVVGRGAAPAPEPPSDDHGADVTKFYAPPASATDSMIGWLVFVSGAARGQIKAIGSGTTRVGSAPNNEIQISDDYVSGHHAELSLEGSSFRLRDLRSRNGTLLNDERVSGDEPLRDGDRIRFGLTEFVFKSVQL